MCNNDKKYSEHDSSQESILNPVTPSVKEIRMITADHTIEPVELVEKRSTGTIALSVYFAYIFSGGYYCRVLGLLLVCLLTQILSFGVDYWITYW